ncbi:hypothetical protein [Nostoc sp. TCL26-01]|uniref:hypothetical protein n=1 Tax=Nostoc sp. TCL26-01 TaxID=2576904 RepID=UPI0015B89DD0|nr:hypothetical protein [Nostoc sp. TCL26-01]QLE54593.1 hypothetical protein FD725_03135 [Nostoc sp. TCL26-01]
MKFKSASIIITLGVIANLFTVSLLPRLSLTSARIPVKDTNCPIPTEYEPVVITFLNSRCYKVKLERPRTFYRYYSDEKSNKGRYITTNRYQVNIEAIQNLALNQSWTPPNRATKRIRVTLPAGTIVYEGKAAPQEPQKCYPGGGQQTWLENPTDPNIKWSEPEDMIVQDFSCQ